MGRNGKGRGFSLGRALPLGVGGGESPFYSDLGAGSSSLLLPRHCPLLAPSRSSRQPAPCLPGPRGRGFLADVTQGLAGSPRREAGPEARSGAEWCRADRGLELGLLSAARTNPRVRPQTPARRRYVRPQARLEPVLRGLRLPGLLPRRGDPMPERARPAPPPRCAHVFRRLFGGAARRLLPLWDPARYVPGHRRSSEKGQVAGLPVGLTLDTGTTEAPPQTDASSRVSSSPAPWRGGGWGVSVASLGGGRRAWGWLSWAWEP